MAMEGAFDLRGVVVRALAMELKVSEAAVEGARSLKSELKMDSIAAANVAFVVEEALGVEIEITKDDDIDTVGAIIAVVLRSTPGLQVEQ